jgi:alkanesulfonate monooxygenase SsuD/methylene tetrahydromethanopterin reductase-like flavin-dependent oxidoreductase (luciferase family)
MPRWQISPRIPSPGRPPASRRRPTVGSPNGSSAAPDPVPIELYWSIGQAVRVHQEQQGWGTQVIKRLQQAEQIGLYRQAWKEAGHEREPRVSVSRSIFALTDERDWQYFGRDRHSSDQVGNIDEKTRAVFGRSYAGAPDELAAKLAEDEAIATADTLLLTVPNQLGVDYNAHVIESILKYVAPQLGWR